MIEKNYANIREILAPCLGQTIVDITQHDAEDFDKDPNEGFVALHLANGHTLKFPTPISYRFVLETPDDEEGEEETA